ncbi:hypothetical protein FRC0290_01933 [Corynebacterium diphtheriae]|nr:hypothetical protein FRC0290_01933 [Corynebacterium diphtheriae]CAB1024515.1 hypothetical protein FRC0534_02096 [Corynebacterium diphtheriae]
MGDVQPHGSGHMMLNIADGHPTGIQAHDHVIDIR